jgi:hypothetical protein
MPPWEITCFAFCACRVVVSMSRVAQWPSHHAPSVGTQLAWCTLMFESSHRPHGKLTFCSFFAGRWCRCQGWHSVNRELPDLLQHSCLCARSSSKVPIAPMGDSPFARCLQGGGVYVGVGTVAITVAISSCTISENTASGVRAHAQNFPSPPWETHVLLVFGRAAVSMSGVAECQS